MSDFRINLQALKTEMEEEQSGPYHLRPACQTLVRWVMLAGGTVRGVKHNHGGGGSGECCAAFLRSGSVITSHRED